MPNWCDNILTIEGPAEELARFVSKVRESGSLLGATVPCPESLKEVGAGSMEDAYHILYGRIPYRNIPEDLSINMVNPSEEDREALFVHHFGPSDSSMEKKRAAAKQYKHNMDTYGHLTWYTWCVANWGTKWDVFPDLESLPEISSYQSTANHGSWTYSFDTAWAPPKAWLLETSERFPTLQFLLEYHEMGCWFAGYLACKEGVRTSELEGEPDDKNSQGELVFPFCEALLADVEEWEREEEEEEEV